MIFGLERVDVIEYDFCPHREYLGISQGKIISVNWLLCNRFFELFTKNLKYE